MKGLLYVDIKGTKTLSFSSIKMFGKNKYIFHVQYKHTILYSFEK